MTDNLLQTVEEKVMSLLTELESLRKELSQAKQENAQLKSEKVNHTQKLQGLISLLDTLDVGQDLNRVHEHNFAQTRVEEAAAI